MLSAPGAAMAAAPEAAASWDNFYDRDTDDGDSGGVSIYEDSVSSGGSKITAEFKANGEHLYVGDAFNNDHNTAAYLWVGGDLKGPYAGEEGSTYPTHYNLSHAEGQSVYIQVCTSVYDGAVCTDKDKYRGVS